MTALAVRALDLITAFPLVARVVLLIGIVAGALGALSNTHLTPFLSA